MRPAPHVGHRILGRDEPRAGVRAVETAAHQCHIVPPEFREGTPKPQPCIRPYDLFLAQGSCCAGNLPVRSRPSRRLLRTKITHSGIRRTPRQAILSARRIAAPHRPAIPQRAGPAVPSGRSSSTRWGSRPGIGDIRAKTLSLPVGTPCSQKGKNHENRLSPIQSDTGKHLRRVGRHGPVRRNRRGQLQRTRERRPPQLLRGARTAARGGGQYARPLRPHARRGVAAHDLRHPLRPLEARTVFCWRTPRSAVRSSA